MGNNLRPKQTSRLHAIKCAALLSNLMLGQTYLRLRRTGMKQGFISMATIRELLQEKLDRAIKEHGPDDQLAKALQAQIASLGTVRHPSQLAALNSTKNDSYHGATLQKPSEAPADPMLPAMNGLEDAMLQMAAQWRATDELEASPTTSGSQGSAAADCLDEVGRK